MSASPAKQILDLAGAHAMLDLLLHPFVDAGFAFDGDFVQPHDIPFPDDSLLVHHDHMTVQLERHFGHPVVVDVLHEHTSGSIYTRMIELTAGERRVEYGIARLNLEFLAQDVRDEILARRKPLGSILIAHDVHRRVKPRYFVRLPAHSQVIALFTAEEYAAPSFGRLGTIYCNDEPAIELLEIVVNTNGTKSETEGK